MKLKDKLLFISFFLIIQSLIPLSQDKEIKQQKLAVNKDKDDLKCETNTYATDSSLADEEVSADQNSCLYLGCSGFNF